MDLPSGTLVAFTIGSMDTSAGGVVSAASGVPGVGASGFGVSGVTTTTGVEPGVA